jgi:3-oxoadipate enol-lactonase
MDALVRGARLAYDDSDPGGGAPLTVYLHGLTGSRAKEDSSGRFDPGPILRSGRRLVRYDARGHGRSGGELVESDYAWPNLAQDLLAFLDVLGADGPVSAIGASMGTATLLHALVAAPSRFDRVVLTCPPTAWETRAAQADAYRTGAQFAEDNGKDAYIARAMSMPRPPVLAQLPDSSRIPDIEESLLPTVLRGAASSNVPPPEQIAQLRLPVLVLAWDGDPGHPVSTAQRLQELIPGAQLHVSTTPEDLGTWGERAAQFLS